MDRNKRFSSGEISMSWENILKVDYDKNIDHEVRGLIMDKISSEGLADEPKNINIDETLDVFRVAGNITSSPFPDRHKDMDRYYIEGFIIEANLTVSYKGKKVADYVWDNDLYSKKHDTDREHDVFAYNINAENLPKGWFVGIYYEGRD